MHEGQDHGSIQKANKEWTEGHTRFLGRLNLKRLDGVGLPSRAQLEGMVPVSKLFHLSSLSLANAQSAAALMCDSPHLSRNLTAS